MSPLPPPFVRTPLRGNRFPVRPDAAPEGGGGSRAAAENTTGAACAAPAYPGAMEPDRARDQESFRPPSAAHFSSMSVVTDFGRSIA
ncbi:MAG: hypothetical protein Kow00128_22090 [Deltaproteobacteria bacterium]